MTDIAKINGVAAASVGKHLGVASANIAKVAGADFPGGFTYPYPVDNSCMFTATDSTYMDYTPSVAGDMRTNTFSCWFKPLKYNTTGSNINSLLAIQIAAGGGGIYIYSNSLVLDVTTYQYLYTGPAIRRKTFGLLRDFSAWYNVVVQLDTTKADPDDRITIWTNGVEHTTFDIATNTTAQNEQMMALNPFPHTFGRQHQYARHTDMMFAQHCMCDGQAYTADDFGEFVNGIWVPKDITGLTFGSKGWLLDMADSADLGNDVSGGGNDWATYNMGTEHQSTDTPTNNFATVEALYPDTGSRWTNTEGNLKSVFSSGAYSNQIATFAPTTGKWYFEVKLTNWTGGGGIGLVPPISNIETYLMRTYGYVMHSSGDKWAFGVSGGAYGASFGATRYLMCAVDFDAGSVWWGQDGVWLQSGDPAAGTNYAYTGLTGGPFLMGCYTSGAGDTFQFNFGNPPPSLSIASGNPDDNGYGNFGYAPPTGFMALCSANLQDSAGTDPVVGEFVGNQGFYSELFTHNGTTHDITLPWDTDIDDTMVMVKNISASESWFVADTVQGNDSYLKSDTNVAAIASANSVSFSGNTVTLGSDFSANNYMIYAFRAGVAYGFDIVSYTGDGIAGRTVAHGLGVKPDCVLVKNLDVANGWMIQHQAMGAYYTRIDSGLAFYSYTPAWNDTEADAANFTLGTYSSGNGSGEALIAYVWVGIEGFSYFGSYTGNANADGPFVNCGFSPAMSILKISAASWAVHSNDIDTNVMDDVQYLDTAVAVTTAATYQVDHVSNGIKIRTADNAMNESGKVAIVMAWAAQPFKYATAR